MNKFLLKKYFLDIIFRLLLYLRKNIDWIKGKFTVIGFQFFFTLLIITTSLWDTLQASVNMGVVTSLDYVGDREVAWRIKIAAERLGWNVILDEDGGRQLKNNQLDLTLCLLSDCKFFNSSYPNYLTIFHPFSYLNDKRRLRAFFEKYDGYLLTINERETLRRGLKKSDKKFHHIPFYPTVYSIPYKELALNDLVVMIPVWGKRLSDPKFSTLYKLLSQSGFAKFYGVNSNQNIDPKHYMGSIPFDGISVIDVLQKHGIALIIHSAIHNRESIPTSRIFEAAAASTIIISDENPFVKKHFKDSVFYIDTSTSGESIFSQIQEHLFTIFQNPEKALEMAKKSHQIFTNKFTMENQLLDLETMHKEIMSKREKN